MTKPSASRDLFCDQPKPYRGRGSYAGKCGYCKTSFISKRPDKKWCSNRCSWRGKDGSPKTRRCGHCGTSFGVKTRSDANRKYCARACSRAAQKQKQNAWAEAHPGHRGFYREGELARRPDIDRERSQSRRSSAIDALGGKCVVCGVTKTAWLEIDYIPTTRGLPFRHPKHAGFVLKNLKDFRLLCANHHRELTTTGRIDGTEITQ